MANLELRGCLGVVETSCGRTMKLSAEKVAIRRRAEGMVA